MKYALTLLPLLLSFVFFAGCVSTTSSPARYHAIFEATAAKPEQWEGILNNVENLRKALGPGATEIEVVAHGKALGMIMKSNEPQRERIEQLTKDGVVFAACENAMRRMNVTRDQLFPFATTVDSAVAELVRKQSAGWAYIRTAP